MPTPMTRIRTLVLAVVATFAVATPAPAAFFVTGDPVADSPSGSPDTWLFVGNSLADGKYIRGDGNFGFDMYRAQVHVFDVFGLEAATGWHTSDSIIAMGGVIVTPTSPLAGLIGAAVNSNLTQHVRIVSKFTNLTAGFTASSVAPGLGNGHGSFSNGDGGFGSILIATSTDTGPMTQQVTTVGAGILTLAGINQRYNGGPMDIPSGSARFIYTIDTMGDSDPTNDRLKSWEVLLNRDSLIRYLNSGGGSINTVVPDWDGHWNQGLQRGTNDFTDAINQHSPLPPTLVALVGGAGLLGLGRRLRRGVA